MLPILVLMDMVSLWTWRGVSPTGHDARHHAARLAHRHRHRLDDRAAGGRRACVRFIVGAIAIIFVGRFSSIQCARHGAGNIPPSPAVPAGLLLGAGGRLHQLRRPCRRAALPGLCAAAPYGPAGIHRHGVIFFAITTRSSSCPISLLGQFDAANLAASAVLMPAGTPGDAGRRLAGQAHAARRSFTPSPIALSP